MFYLTELEERLAGENSNAVRDDTLLRLAAMEMRLQRMMSTQLMPPEKFKMASVLATAAKLGQNAVRMTDDVPQ